VKNYFYFLGLTRVGKLGEFDSTANSSKYANGMIEIFEGMPF